MAGWRRFSFLVVLALGPTVRALPPDPATAIGVRADGKEILAGSPLHDQDLAGSRFFPEADLREADFSRSDLTKAVLHGTDLARAQFTGATVAEDAWKGARFQDTRMPDGSLRNPTLAALVSLGEKTAAAPAAPEEPRPPAPSKAAIQAERTLQEQRRTLGRRLMVRGEALKPFFATDLPFGTIRELYLGTVRVNRMASVQLGLALALANVRHLTLVTPGGCAIHPLPAVPETFGAQGEVVWYTSGGLKDLTMVRLPANRGPFQRLKANLTTTPLPVFKAATGPWSAVVPSANFLWLVAGRTLFQMPCQGMLPDPPTAKASAKVPRTGPMVAAYGLGTEDAYTLLAPGPEDSVAYGGGHSAGFMRPGAPGGKAEQGFEFNCPQDRIVTRVLLATDGWLYYLVKGKDAVYRSRTLDKTTMESETIPMDTEKCGLFDLAEGPGGTIWFTATTGNAIAMINPKTETLKWFPLPQANSMPAYLVRGRDDKMYFTQAGSSRIGSITAVLPKPVAPKPEAAQPEAPKPMPPKPMPPKPVAVPAKPAQAPPKPTQVPAKEAEVPAKPMEPTAKAPEPPLPSLALTHIAREHYYGALNAKGQFLHSLSRDAAVTSLIALALDGPRVLDLDGRWLAMREFKSPIGHTWDCEKGSWELTGKLLVVLNPEQDAVITAYPVQRF